MPFRTRRPTYRRAAISPGRGAFTLIELLLSLAIGIMVVALVFTTHLTVTAVLRGQRERDEGPRAMAAAGQLLRHDLSTLFLPSDDRECALSLETDLHGSVTSSVLEFCGEVVTEGEEDARWADTVHFRYALDPSPQGGQRLIRVRHVLVGPASATPPVTNVLVAAIDRFHVEFFDGRQWQAAWPPESDSNSAPPTLARVWVGGPSSDIFLPVGAAVTSQIERAATAAPAASPPIPE